MQKNILYRIINTQKGISVCANIKSYLKSLKPTYHLPIKKLLKTYLNLTKTYKKTLPLKKPTRNLKKPTKAYH